MIEHESILSIKILIVDDHEAVLGGTVNAIKNQYPQAEIYQAQTTQKAIEQTKSLYPNLNLAIVDISLPEVIGEKAKPETGIKLLRTLMKEYPTLNIVVQSAEVRTLIRLRPNIYEHKGGFTVADKSIPLKEMLTKVDWALQGIIYTPKEMRSGLEFKEEWLRLLQLAFKDGLQDKEIAKKLSVAERTVRHYWTQIQDALEVYPDPGKSLRIQTEIRAREEGLID
jgi:DNA-binding NarL/FixJ family response regulator